MQALFLPTVSIESLSIAQMQGPNNTTGSSFAHIDHSVSFLHTFVTLRPLTATLLLLSSSTNYQGCLDSAEALPPLENLPECLPPPGASTLDKGPFHKFDLTIPLISLCCKPAHSTLQSRDQCCSSQSSTGLNTGLAHSRISTSGAY